MSEAVAVTRGAVSEELVRESSREPSRAHVSIRGLRKEFPEVRAVDDIDLDIAAGEIVCLLGPSGCGKTTTLRMVAGLETPESGSIVVGDSTVVDVSGGVVVPPHKRNIGMVFQSYAVWPHMTVRQNVGYPLKLRRVKRAELDERVREMLVLTGLEQVADRAATRLSGGQQQRVALARALVYRPSLLLLDEPLSNLDANLRDQMRTEIKRVQRELGVTILFVTHDQGEAMELADTVAVMNEGRIEQLGPPLELYERPRTPFVRDFLGRVVMVAGTLRRTADAAAVDVRHGPGAERRTRVAISLEQATRVADLQDGAEVLAACRPEDITFEEGWPDEDGVLHGVIESAVFVGDHREYHVRVGDRSCEVWGARSRREGVGSRVGLRMDASTLSVWPVDES